VGRVGSGICDYKKRLLTSYSEKINSPRTVAILGKPEKARLLLILAKRLYPAAARV
jgi:hypothetical protein